MRLVYALTASLARGLQYTLLSELFTKIPVMVFFAISSTVGMLFWRIMIVITKTTLPIREYFKDSHTLWLMIIVIILFILGNAVIVLAIKGKNATVASIIEISYPLFVVLFSYLIYRNTHLNFWTIVGGILVLIGIVMVYISNR